MNVTRSFRGIVACFLLSTIAAIANNRPAVDSARVKNLFRQPPREYSTGPLWVWNDRLTDEQIRSTLRDLAAQQVRQVWVHPRPGLMTPYLSDEWFRLWKVALAEAKRLDMNVWIYDENSYPSGFAGGWVPELMPAARGRGLRLAEQKTPPKWNDTLLGVFRLKENAAENVTAAVQAGEATGEGRYLVASVIRAENQPWTANRCYVDLMYPGVTEKFLEVTLDAYRRHFGKEFGKRIPGSFTDEPNLHSTSGLPWTADLPEQFKRRRGYDLIENLPSLAAEIGDWKRVRHDYYRTQLELFIERWGRPYFEYCRTHHLEFTGHYWEHEWPLCRGVPDNMALEAWEHRPGIDILMNQYQERCQAQFGNLRACREISSLGNQLGRRTFVEVYGAAGWDLRFQDMKRIGDWLEVLGVNTLNQHLSYVTLRGARKRDHPQSFSYHEPWWEAYHISAEYFARLSAALSQGEQVNSVLVLEPTPTAWMYQGNDAKLNELGESFFQLLLALEAAQVEYDLGCENVLADHGTVSRGRLQVGRRDYDLVVIPPHTETLDARTWELLYSLLHEGGRVLCCAPSVERCDGKLEGSPAHLVTANERWEKVASGELPARLMRRQLQTAATVVARAPGDKGILFHHTRRLRDGELLFLVNTSLESPSRGTVLSALDGVETWDPATGEVAPYHFTRNGGKIRADFELPPSGSRLLFVSRKPIKPAPATAESVTTLPATGPVASRRVEPNVLTLDYVDVTAGGETKSNVYFYAAQQFAFQKNGLPRNPWDSAVQFKDEIIAKTFPPDSGFTASYRFTIQDAVPANLAIVIERPDLYTITCNGQPLAMPALRPSGPDAHSRVAAVEFEDWWLDKSFGRIPIAAAARVGENTVTIRAQPFTVWHELEPAYVLGDFALTSTEKGFVIAPDRPLPLGEWNKLGHPFYAAGVVYRQRFDVAERSGRFVVSLPKWYGSVAKVSVNGKPAGYIDAPPWERDVTGHIRRGVNTVEVTVIGTLKNTLGPHHGHPALGAAWPHAFQVGPPSGPPPGESYSTVGYGLFEPFELKLVSAAASPAGR